jgi:hypothetical protein
MQYIDIKDLGPRYAHITLEMVLEWERLMVARDHGGPVIRRIWSGLMALDHTGRVLLDSQSIREVRSPDGTRYRLSTWRSRPDYKIELIVKPTFWDLID